MPIPAGDIVLLEGQQHTLSLTVNVFPKEEVATAQVAATPFIYPIGSLTVTNTSAGWNNIRLGQLVEVKDGDNLVSFGVVRKPPTSSELYIDGKARGDAGYAQRIHRAFQAGQDVTVYSYQPLWSLLSRIKDGVFYKKFDIPYDGSGSNPPPVVNLGSWRVGRADPKTGRASFSFHNDFTFAWGGKTISSYSWSLPPSAVVTSGALNSDSITFTLPPGFYRVFCTVTDSGGASTTAMRPIWVNDPVLYPALSDKYTIKIESDQQDQQGRNMTLRVYGDIDPDDIMPGAAFIITETALYDGQSLSTGVGVTTYVGFSSSTTGRYEIIEGEKSVTYELKSPYHRAEDIAMVSQAIIEKPSPSDWTEVAQGLGIPDFIGFYVLKHHSTFLDMFDYHPLHETPVARKKNWGLNGSSLAEYIGQVGRIIGGNMGCTSDGSMYLRRNPNIEENDFRDALDVRFVWQPQHIVEPVEIPERLLPTVGQLKAFAFSYDDSDEPVPVAAIAHGYQQGQGTTKTDAESMVIPAVDPQDKINRISGHILAQMNNPTPEVILKVNRNMDIAEPALMLWHRLNIPAVYSPTGKNFNTRALVKTVDRSWEEIDGITIKNITMSFIPETFGQPGEKFDLNREQATIYPPEEPPMEEDIFEMLGFIVAWNSEGNIGRTFDGESWHSIKGNMEGVVNDFCIDPFCSFVLSGFVEGFLGGFCVATIDNILLIWHSFDILADTVEWELQAAYEMDDNSTIYTARIAASETEADFLVAAWRDRTSTKVVRCFDAMTWGEPIEVGSATNDDDNDNAEIGLAVDGEVHVVTAKSTLGNYQVYRATSKNGSFSLMSNAPLVEGIFSTRPVNMLYIDSEENRLYASRVIEEITINPATEYIYFIDPAFPGSDVRGGTGLNILKPQPGEVPTSFGVTPVTIENPEAFKWTMRTAPVEKGEATISVPALSPNAIPAIIDIEGTSPRNALVVPFGDAVPEQSSPANDFSGGSERPFGIDWFQRITLDGWYQKMQSHNHRWGMLLPTTEDHHWAYKMKIRLEPDAITTFKVLQVQWTVTMYIHIHNFEFVNSSPSGLAESIPESLRDVEWKATLNLYADGEEEAVYSSSTIFTTQDAPLTWQDFSGIGFVQIKKTQTFTHNVSPGIEDILYMDVFVEQADPDAVLHTGSSSGDVITLGTFNRPRFQLEIDKIAFSYESKTVKALNLYRVENYEGVGAEWEDITPSDEATPRYPYAFTLDAGQSERLRMIGTVLNERYYYESDDDADHWLGTIETVPYVGLRSGGVLAIYFGDGALDLVAGGELFDLTGNWTSTIGAIGTIRGVVALL